MPAIGVLALQGDVREHLHALDEAGATARPVRRLAEIEAADGLVSHRADTGTYVPAMVDNDVTKLEEYYRSFGYLDVRVARQLSYDPNGIQFELNFHSAYEERQGVAVDPNNFLKAGLEWFDPEAYRQFETACP